MGGDSMKDSIIFKKYDKSDNEAFERTLENVWNYHEYTDNETIRRLFIKTDVYKSLCESDYKECVYVDGLFAGIVLGKISPIKAMFINGVYYLKFLKYVLLLKVHSNESRHILKNFKVVYKVYKALLKKKQKYVKSELILFMVDPLFQRQGLGKLLVERFEKALIKKSKKNYFLFTDSQCNYEFYETNLYTKVEQESTSESLKNGQRELTIMLYSKHLRGR
jgi:GNAT superfamily N-acetyltransferase